MEPLLIAVVAFCFRRATGLACWHCPIVHRGSKPAIVSEPGHSWKGKVDTPQKKMSLRMSELERVQEKDAQLGTRLAVSLCLCTPRMSLLVETNEGMATQQQQLSGGDSRSSTDVVPARTPLFRRYCQEPATKGLQA